MPKVVRILSPAGDKAIRVDRATDWGNPFIMKKEADRERVCDQYEAYAQWRLTIDPTWLEQCSFMIRDRLYTLNTYEGGPATEEKCTDAYHAVDEGTMTFRSIQLYRYPIQK